MDFEIEDDDQSYDQSYEFKPQKASQQKKSVFSSYSVEEEDPYNFEVPDDNFNYSSSKMQSPTKNDVSQTKTRTKAAEPISNESNAQLSALERAQSMLNKYSGGNKAAFIRKSKKINDSFDEDDISLDDSNESENFQINTNEKKIKKSDQENQTGVNSGNDVISKGTHSHFATSRPYSVTKNENLVKLD